MIGNHSHSWLGWDWEKIDYNNLKNKPTWWFYNTTKSYSVFTHGAWAFAVTWVWFKPKLVSIWAVRSPNWVDPTFSLNEITETSPWTFTYSELYHDNSWNSYIWSSLAIRIADAGGSPATTASMLSFDTDWFTLNFLSTSWNVEMKITCYW